MRAFIIAFWCAVAASCAPIEPAFAQFPGLPEDTSVQHGTLTACDTKEQVQEYVEAGQSAAAMEIVNNKYGENACVNGAFFYIEGEDGGTFNNWTFLHILVTGEGHSAVTPMPRWTAYRTPGVDA